MKYNKLNADAKKCMRISALLSLLITSIILITLRIILRNTIPNELIKFIDISIMGIIALLLLNLLFMPTLRYKRYRYIITDDKIEIIEGAIFIEKVIIPIERIHQISVDQGPIDRIYKLAKVTVSTAGSTANISFLDIKEADIIGDKLKDKINELVVKGRDLKEVQNG